MLSLITGAGGFAGRHLSEYLLSQNLASVWGCGKSSKLKHKIEFDMNYRCIDLTDSSAVITFLDEIRPNQIYHLAGQATVHTSWTNPMAHFDSNVYTTLNILDAVSKLKLNCKILVVTSMEVYGDISTYNMPIKENSSFRPNSPYGASKASQDLLAQSYGIGHKLNVVRVRPLNHIGPRQNDQFVATAFARQIAQIEEGLQPPNIMVGNLSASRDFTDVRDMVRAYSLVMEHSKPGIAYNIASGNSYTIQEILDILISLTNINVTVKVDPNRVRKSNTPALIADCSEFNKIADWKPKYPIQQTLSDLLDYERKQLNNNN